MNVYWGKFSKGTVTGINVFSVLIWASSLTTVSATSLWDRSYQRMQDSGLWMPSELTVCEEVIDQTGIVTSNGCMDYTTEPSNDIESLTFTPVSPTKESKQQTDILDFLKNMGIGVPYFVPQALVETTQRSDRKSVDGIECMGYDFTTSGPGRTYVGTVWLHPDTASPKVIEMRMDAESPVKYKNSEIDHFYRTLQMKETDGCISAYQLTAEAWVSSRRLLKRNMHVRKFSLAFHSFWKVDTEHSSATHYFSQNN